MRMPVNLSVNKRLLKLQQPDLIMDVTNVAKNRAMEVLFLLSG
jgi:hypothetical protein